MVSEGRLSEPEPKRPNERGITNWGVKLTVLFDKELQKCYFFKYSKTLRFAFENKGNNTALIDAEFSRNIQNIVELDNQFNPVWNINIQISNNKYDFEQTEIGRLGAYDVFFPCEDSYCFKSKSLLYRSLNISNITYQELNNQFGITAAERDSMKINIYKVDLDVLFSGSLPGFVDLSPRQRSTYE